MSINEDLCFKPPKGYHNGMRESQKMITSKNKIAQITEYLLKKSRKKLSEPYLEPCSQKLLKRHNQPMFCTSPTPH